MANAFREKLGQRIKELRRARSWRQIDLAAHSGINPTLICDLETGKRDFCMDTLIALAEALDTKPSEILRSVGR